MLHIDLECNQTGCEEILRQVQWEGDVENGHDLVELEFFGVLEPVPVDECRP